MSYEDYLDALDGFETPAVTRAREKAAARGLGTGRPDDVDYAPIELRVLEFYKQENDRG